MNKNTIKHKNQNLEIQGSTPILSDRQLLSEYMLDLFCGKIKRTVKEEEFF